MFSTRLSTPFSDLSHFKYLFISDLCLLVLFVQMEDIFI